MAMGGAGRTSRHEQDNVHIIFIIAQEWVGSPSIEIEVAEQGVITIMIVLKRWMIHVVSRRRQVDSVISVTPPST